MDASSPSGGKQRHPLRWALWLGWLAIVAAIAISLAAATGAKSESQLIEASVYPAAGFGFGVGTLFGARWFRDTSSPVSQRYVAVAFIALLFVGLALWGRAYFFENIFYKL